MARRTTENTASNDTASKAANGKTNSSRKMVQREIVPPAEASKRSYLKQSDVPTASLDEAMRLPQAIFDHYAGKATSPFNVAKALNVDPKGSQLRVISGGAIAYGLIEGGAQANAISVTDLARRIARPMVENEDNLAKREAVLKPRVFREFLTNYDGNQFPRHDIALNVLEGMGVPRDKTEDVLGRISDSARSVGFITEIKGKYYVQLNNEESATGLAEASRTPPTIPVTDPLGERDLSVDEQPRLGFAAPAPLSHPRGAALAAAAADDQRRRRVFITHGRDRGLVDPIKKLLEYGELEPIVSVEKQSVSKPVPEKVMDDMRSCGAAIIHVDADKIITDATGNENVILNPNVLIEIGAAMAFYGRRFILLVKNGVKLPSNLQGLYEVRYNGDTLDATSTIALLEAMKDIKNHALPTDADIDGE